MWAICTPDLQQRARAGVAVSATSRDDMTNVGKTPATYLVLQWYTPLTPKS